jgi:stringent starvation protein B
MTNDDVASAGASAARVCPWTCCAAVLAIYARETGQGMIFNDDDAPQPPPPPGERGDASKPSAQPSDDKPPKPTSPSDQRRAKFKVVK